MKWSSSTHWVNGSQTTGQPSWTPNSSAGASMSSGAVTGVIRSTMQLGKATLASIQSARSGSLSRAKAQIIRWATSPLSGRLSHDITVNGARPARGAGASPAVM